MFINNFIVIMKYMFCCFYTQIFSISYLKALQVSSMESYSVYIITSFSICMYSFLFNQYCASEFSKILPTALRLFEHIFKRLSKLTFVVLSILLLKISNTIFFQRYSGGPANYYI